MSEVEAPKVTPPPNAGARALDAPGRRGRAIFFAGAALYALWELAPLGAQIYYDSPLVMRSGARVVLGLSLFFFAWRGRTWAAALITLMFTAACLLGWHTALGDGRPWTAGALTTVVPTLLGLYGIALHAAPSVRSYLAFQRAND